MEEVNVLFPNSTLHASMVSLDSTSQKLHLSLLEINQSRYYSQLDKASLPWHWEHQV